MREHEAVSEFDVYVSNPATTTTTRCRLVVDGTPVGGEVRLGAVGPRGGRQPAFTMTPDEARWLARKLYTAADIAESVTPGLRSGDV